MESKKKFVPVCFKKDITNIAEYMQNNSKSIFRNIVKKEIPTGSKLSAKDIYTIIKNLNITLNKCLSIEYSKQRLKVKEASKILNVSKNCDIFLIKTMNRKFFNMLKYEVRFKVIRFYSFSTVNNCFFFMFKVVDELDYNIKYCKGGIIIPNSENKILFFLKKSEKEKNVDMKKIKEFLEIIIEDIKVVLEVIHKFVSKEELERMSTVTTLENETNFERDSNTNSKFYPKMIQCNLTEESLSEMFDNTIIEKEYESAADSSIVEFGDIDLEYIQIQSDLIFKEHCKPKFVIDEEDEDYKIVRELNEYDLEKCNLLQAYFTLRDEMKEEIKEYNLSENELVRYIYGWKGDVVNVKKTLIELHHWRNEYKPHMLKEEDFLHAEINFKQMMHVACQDIYGRPVILLRAKHLLPNKLPIDLFARYLIFIIEHAISLMPPNVDKLALVVDIQDAGYGNMAINHIKHIKELTSKFYVERLSKIIIINKSFFFGMIWNFISSFLEERVLKKLVVVDESNMPWFRKIMGDSINKL